MFKVWHEDPELAVCAVITTLTVLGGLLFLGILIIRLIKGLKMTYKDPDKQRGANNATYRTG